MISLLGTTGEQIKSLQPGMVTIFEAVETILKLSHRLNTAGYGQCVGYLQTLLLNTLHI